jgi:hypothetical protein
MSSNIKIITDEYPLVLIRAISEPNEEEIDYFTKELEEKLSQTVGKFIIISDQSNEVFISAKVRIKLGKRLTLFSEKYNARELAVFIVIKSAIGRIMINGINRFSKSHKKLKVVFSLEEAKSRANVLIDVFA